MRFATILCTFLLVLTVTFAQQPKSARPFEGTNNSTGSTYALIIGVSNYKNLPKLEYADDDALAFRDYLINTQNVPPNNINLLINDSASTTRIFDKIYQLEHRIKAEDKFIFYFSGHGDWESTIYSKNALLLLSGAPKAHYLKFPSEYLDCNELNGFFENLTSLKIKTVLIVDACRSGNLIGGREGAKSAMVQLQKWSNDVRMLSCQPDQLSYEHEKWGGGRGVFSYYLMKGLMGAGVTEVSKVNYVTLDDVSDYLKANIKRETSGMQYPLIQGDPRTVVSIVPEQIVKMAKDTEDGIMPSNLVGRGAMNTTRDSLGQLRSLLGTQIKHGNLVLPLGNNALDTYIEMVKISRQSYLPEEFASLLDAISAKFQEYAMKYYNDLSFPMEELELLELELKYAGQLTEGNSYLQRQFQVKRLFIAACIETYMGQHSIQRSVPRENLIAAIDILEEAAVLAPFEPLVFKKLGECYLPMRPSKGIENYNRYLQLLPNDPMAYNAIGLAYAQMKKYDEAIESFKKAVSLASDKALHYYNLGVTYRAAGNEELAQYMFNKADQEKLKSYLKDEND